MLNCNNTISIVFYVRALVETVVGLVGLSFYIFFQIPKDVIFNMKCEDVKQKLLSCLIFKKYCSSFTEISGEIFVTNDNYIYYMLLLSYFVS